MTTAKPSTTLDASLPTSAASDSHHALPRPVLPRRPRYTGRMPAWAWRPSSTLHRGNDRFIRTSSVTEREATANPGSGTRRLNSEIRSLAAHRRGNLALAARSQHQGGGASTWFPPARLPAGSQTTSAWLRTLPRDSYRHQHSQRWLDAFTSTADPRMFGLGSRRADLSSKVVMQKGEDSGEVRPRAAALSLLTCEMRVVIALSVWTRRPVVAPPWSWIR